MNNSYKEHIQFLRAIAVIFVFLYHLKIPYFYKGYLGVDIFFVISGYVITKQLLTKYFSENKIDLGGFYISRLKRLFPALVVVCLSTYFFFQFFGPSSLTPIKQTIFSILGISNIYFLIRNKDYFDNIFDDPLGHTWSLGLEEQTYLVYPLLLILFYQFLKKNLVFYIILALGLFSFVTYFLFSKSHSNLVFYLPIFRFWEFAAGACIYLYFKNLTFKNDYIFYFIFILINLFLIYLDLEYVFYNIIVVFLTSLLIIFSTSSKLFINKFFIYIGNISYSIYLVHLPVIYFLDIYFFGFIKFFLSILITIVLSIILYELIEKKFRYIKFKDKIFKFLIFSFSFLLIFFIYIKHFNNELRENIRAFILKNNYLEKNYNWKKRTLANYKVNNKLFYEYCRKNAPKKYSLNEWGLKNECLKLDKTNKEVIFYLEGNSLTAQFAHTIDKIDIIKNAYYKLNHFYKISHQEVNYLSRKYDELVYVTEINTDEYFGLSKIDAIRQVKEKFNPNVKILLIFSNPRDTLNYPVKCMVQKRSCEIDIVEDKKIRKLNKLLNEIDKLLVKNSNIYFYNAYKNLCSINKCFSYNSKNNFLMLRDSNHLSVEATESLVPSLKKFVSENILID